MPRHLRPAVKPGLRLNPGSSCPGEETPPRHDAQSTAPGTPPGSCQAARASPEQLASLAGAARFARRSSSCLAQDYRVPRLRQPQVCQKKYRVRAARCARRTYTKQAAPCARPYCSKLEARWSPNAKTVSAHVGRGYSWQGLRGASFLGMHRANQTARNTHTARRGRIVSMNVTHLDYKEPSKRRNRKDRRPKYEPNSWSYTCRSCGVRYEDLADSGLTEVSCPYCRHENTVSELDDRS